MFTISGKQKFGGVWVNGKCIAVFKRGIATTNDQGAADILRAMGYTVTGEAPAIDPLAGMKVDELKAYATEKGIDLKGAEKKADILKAIREAEAGNKPEGK